MLFFKISIKFFAFLLKLDDFISSKSLRACRVNLILKFTIQYHPHLQLFQRQGYIDPTGCILIYDTRFFQRINISHPMCPNFRPLPIPFLIVIKSFLKIYIHPFNCPLFSTQQTPPIEQQGTVFLSLRSKWRTRQLNSNHPGQSVLVRGTAHQSAQGHPPPHLGTSH